MRKKLFLILVLFASVAVARQPFKGKFYNQEYSSNLFIDLYEESIVVPGMEMFGPMNGYLKGGIYGVWTITSFTLSDDDATATIRLSNDLGSETQEVSLVLLNDSTLSFEQQGSIVIKKAVNKKLVKTERKLTFVRK